jgi:hypothetical protein
MNSKVRLRVFIMLLQVLLLVIVSGCSNQTEGLKSERKSRSNLSQQVTNTTYQFQVPANWEVVYSEIGDPTVFFQDENQIEIGGLVLLRLEHVNDLGVPIVEMTSLATQNYNVFKGMQNDERFICFHLPSKNTGYQLFFKSNKVSEKEMLAIVKTFKFKSY